MTASAEVRPDDDDIATRKASNKVIQWAAERIPNLVSGSADLEPSTLTVIDEGGSVAPGDFSGRNVHYGVREHAMGAIVNGLVLHGWRAFGSTFFNFLDYMKPAVRLASLMEIPSIFVYTHDSIGLGEDGPTHQPVEQLAVLRAQPNMYCVRPADANETALAWQFAIGQTETPTSLVLAARACRSGIPTRSRRRHRRGRTCCASRRRTSPTDPDRHGLRGAHLRQGGGPARAGRAWTRVCPRPASTASRSRTTIRESVLPRSVRARVSVEAATPLGWSTWIGEDGEAIGMTTFAPRPHSPTVRAFRLHPREGRRASARRAGAGPGPHLKGAAMSVGAG